MASPTTSPVEDKQVPTEFQPNPGRALFLLLTAARYNPSEFALRSGVSKSTVSAWINNHSRMDRFKSAYLRDLPGQEIPGQKEPIPEDVFYGSEADVFAYLTRRFGVLARKRGQNPPPGHSLVA